ncbi:MAG: 50S ribosomal protein L23 [Gammaproteobacteria bacterium]
MNQERLLKILKAPHITEKASNIGDDKCSQIIFKVVRDANKIEIKQAVEQLFNVKVQAVQVVNMKPKACRFGRNEGKHKAWKKAYVCLQPGYDIVFDQQQVSE